MASKKTINKHSEVNGVPAVNVAAGADVPIPGILLGTIPKAANGAMQRTRRPKTKSTAATKAAVAKAEEIKSVATKVDSAKEPTKNPKEVSQNDQTVAGKLSALDAAVKILQEEGQPMNCQVMIDAMAAKGYWASPAGKTPAATLYSAIMREIKTKGNHARFQKTARGHFVLQIPQAS